MSVCGFELCHFHHSFLVGGVVLKDYREIILPYASYAKLLKVRYRNDLPGRGVPNLRVDRRCTLVTISSGCESWRRASR